MRVGIVFHIHWWSRWKDVYTFGGDSGRLRAVAANRAVVPMRERHCRCGKSERWPTVTPRGLRLTDEQLDKLGLYPE